MKEVFIKKYYWLSPHSCQAASTSKAKSVNIDNIITQVVGKIGDIFKILWQKFFQICNRWHGVQFICKYMPKIDFNYSFKKYFYFYNDVIEIFITSLFPVTYIWTHGTNKARVNIKIRQTFTKFVAWWLFTHGLSRRMDECHTQCINLPTL